MDRGRSARGGQKPTIPTTRLIKGYSRINAYYTTRLGLRSMRKRPVMLGGTCASTRARHQGGAEGAPRRTTAPGG